MAEWLITCSLFMLFFFNDTATTEIYTLSLHDALPILPFFCRPHLGTRSSVMCSTLGSVDRDSGTGPSQAPRPHDIRKITDRKSTRLNSSHANISYAVFCLKKKKRTISRS